ncbi:MAG: hypothetical protein ACRERE_07400 [Candidatus Entotheonellia bacterium]
MIPGFPHAGRHRLRIIKGDTPAADVLKSVAREHVKQLLGTS